MQDKIVVITGANSGIGKETAKALAAMGATTVLACRNTAKAEAAADEVRKESGSDNVHVVSLDLADLSSVQACATAVLSQWDRLDVLINNAGGMWSKRSVTPQGFEQTFGVNHIGHFYFTALLLDRLQSADEGRIVNLSSIGHHFARKGMAWDDLQSEKHYSGMSVYGQSKLANLLFTRGLATRTSVASNAVHPGPVRSGFGMDGDFTGILGWGNRIIRPFEISPLAGAATSIYVAAAPELKGKTGGYYARSKPGHPSKQAMNAASADRLWTTTEQLITTAGFTLP